MSTYTRELVEHLLPAVWDTHAAYGMVTPGAPDPDMPRAQTDPAHSGTLYAHLADIRHGWQTAPLGLHKRRALLLRYGADWPQKAIAAHEGVQPSTIHERLAVGIGHLVDTLNGTSPTA